METQDKTQGLKVEYDYTQIRNSRVRRIICALMSEMLDNPGEDGIYSTSKFMWQMETFILSEAEPLLDALAEIVDTRPIECDGNFQELYACIIHTNVATEALRKREVLDGGQ